MTSQKKLMKEQNISLRVTIEDKNGINLT